MQALTLHAPYDLRFEEKPAPQLNASHEAIIRVRASALCGSDLHPYRGRETGCDPGTIMGHEFVGEIMTVGNAVKNFRPGQQVFSSFTTCCGQCSCCGRGLTCRCSRGQLLGWVENMRGLHGAQADQVKIPLADSTLMDISNGLTDKTALLLGDNLATGYYGVVRAGVTAGESCVVVGCGTVGLLAVLCSLELGADPVYAIDPQPSRRARAKAMGAQVFAPEEADGLESLAVVEAVGSSAAMKLSFQLTAPGGTIASVGVHTSPGFAFTPADLYDKNLTYRSGRCPARALALELRPVARMHTDTLESLFTHEFPLSQGPEAYRLFERGEDSCQKILLWN
jgi:2-desacetyl-2-hydroxyethyl bacteriochlorophyllide A dehydrogenase